MALAVLAGAADSVDEAEIDEVDVDEADVVAALAVDAAAAVVARRSVAFFLITFCHILFGEIVPKSITIYHPEGVATWTVPPVLFCITKDSRDHSPEVYHEVVLPMFAKLDPAPKVRVTRWGADPYCWVWWCRCWRWCHRPS